MINIPQITDGYLTIELVSTGGLSPAEPGAEAFQLAIENSNKAGQSGNDDAKRSLHLAAIRAFEDAIAKGIDPLHQGYVHSALGELLVDTGDLPGAVDHFVRVFTSMQARQALYDSVHCAGQYLAIILSELGREQEAGALRQLTAKTESRLGYRLTQSATETVRRLVRAYIAAGGACGPADGQPDTGPCECCDRTDRLTKIESGQLVCADCLEDIRREPSPYAEVAEIYSDDIAAAAPAKPHASGLEKKINMDLGGGVTLALTLIPAGKFMMGSPDSEKGRNENEGPRHEVTLSKPFYMGVTEVTQAQYEAVMDRNPSHFKGATNPVEMVSWNDATEFCRKLCMMTRQRVRLPTEAEWEYACRAGTATAFSFGDADSTLGDYAWFTANSGNKTQSVAYKKPNAWGLYDMYGNAWEMCADWYGDYPNGAVTDPQGPTSGPYRVLRGGSWSHVPGHCRSAYRNDDGFYPGNFSSYLGFRVVVPV
jgi:formylglycine-generating enzyme required for sulfatase activity